MLIDVKGVNLDGLREKIQKEVRAAVCQLRGIRISPQEILFQFGQPRSYRIGEGEMIKIMVILDPYPCLEEIDNIDLGVIKAEVKLAAEKAVNPRQIQVCIRCSRSFAGDYCRD